MWRHYQKGRFQLLCSAISSGRAHLAARGNDGRPGNIDAAGRFGWRKRSGINSEWEPRGLKIGWVDGDSIYLGHCNAARKVAEEMAPNGECLPAKKKLHKSLHEAGLLASDDATRGHLTVRVTVSGEREALFIFGPKACVRAEPSDRWLGPIGPISCGLGFGPIMVPLQNVYNQPRSHSNAAFQKRGMLGLWESFRKAFARLVKPSPRTNGRDMWPNHGVTN